MSPDGYTRLTATGELYEPTPDLDEEPLDIDDELAAIAAAPEPRRVPPPPPIDPYAHQRPR